MARRRVRALRVCWMLEELGLAYDIHPVNLKTRFEDKEFLSVSPAGAVPASATVTQPCSNPAPLSSISAPNTATPLTPKPSDPHYPAYISICTSARRR